MERCIIDPQRECFGRAEAAILEKRIEILEKHQGAQEKFMAEYAKEQRERIERNAMLDAKITSMDEKLDQLLSWQDGEKEKPEKLLRNIAEKAILVVLTGIITYVLTKFGLTS